MRYMRKSARTRLGFSTIEVIVFVMMAGLLAAVTTPQVMNKISHARQAATLESLSEIRKVISRHSAAATDGAHPVDLVAEIQDSFPDRQFPVAEAVSPAVNVVVPVTSSPINSDDVTTQGGWLYNSATGEIRVNDLNYVIW